MIIFDLLNNFDQVKEDFKIGKSYYWIVVHSQELDMLKDKFTLKEENIEECKNYTQGAQINFYKDYTFIILNLLKYNKAVEANEINIFLSKDCIITVYKERLTLIEEILDDINESKNCFLLKENPKPFILLYYIIDRIIIKNYEVIATLETKADKIEIDILKEPKHEHIDEIIYLRRQVYRIRKYITPLRYIGDSLTSNDNGVIEKECIKYCITLNNKIEKLMVALETLVQDLSLVREAFESEISNKTNELMKVFTLIATIFLPASLITGLYGMNFDNIPPMKNPYGCFYVLGFTIIISLFLVYFFKRKKWL
ncbi:magnesium transporter CorA family protein [Clostridium sp. Marseille-Q2269]|uniref:magnesium transporter CorA family protein n=1 Tax=Clostridium sp. Marseille-Q2269 TaxID=2942205 RepID=UPI0020738EBD|nr:magnesium transporter CorA family protein [Clostridium sp. Marseille-Q2269]